MEPSQVALGQVLVDECIGCVTRLLRVQYIAGRLQPPPPGSSQQSLAMGLCKPCRSGLPLQLIFTTGNSANLCRVGGLWVLSGKCQEGHVALERPGFSVSTGIEAWGLLRSGGRSICFALVNR